MTVNGGIGFLVCGVIAGMTTVGTWGIFGITAVIFEC